MSRAAIDAGDDRLGMDGWELGGDGTWWRPCQQEYCNQHVLKPATGRPPRYCSDACKMIDYRMRKAAQEREQQRLDELARQERARQAAHVRAERIARQVEAVIAMELAGIPHNSRVSTTQRKALGERITRALLLADLIVS